MKMRIAVDCYIICPSCLGFILICLIGMTFSHSPNLKIVKYDIQESVKLNYGDGKFSNHSSESEFLSRDKVGKPITVQVDVDLLKHVANISNFWRSTGFCPPDPHNESSSWFLSTDILHNLAYIGAVPHYGIEQVRIHWLLDSIEVIREEKNQLRYNFSKLDDLIDRLWGFGLKPGFEIMGNPSNYFIDFENSTQVHLWKDLVYQIAMRYIDQYGLSYVMKWNFESWNEPAPKHFDGLKFTMQGFFNYYDACSEGLRAASSLLILGAPGGECSDRYDASAFCWSLLEHCQSGRNFFTKERGIRIDFISIHKKGEEPNNTATIMEKENTFMNQLKRHLPGLLKVPIVNDEADPLVTWSASKWWRSDVTYAALVAKIIHRHQEDWFVTLKRGDPPFLWLSNDNGFLSYNPFYFSQRTLLARFQLNTTRVNYTQYIRKPVYSVMGLLSLLGDQQVLANIKYLNIFYPLTSPETFGVISSIHKPLLINQQDSYQMAVLFFLSADSHNTTTQEEVVAFHVSGLDEFFTNSSDVVFTMYILDNTNGNPVTVWREQGEPKTPSDEQLRKMRENEEPVRIAGPTRMPGPYYFTWQMSLPSIVLFHVCSRAKYPPGEPSAILVSNITFNQALVVWSDSCVNTKCIKTYEVSFSPTGREEDFTRINSRDTLFTIFVHTVATTEDNYIERIRGYYRIRAVDYWDRSSAWSEAFKY